ncbi:MAG: hypothetical protein V3V99_11405 [candidate division Zixibacteria bacterium]
MKSRGVKNAAIGWGIVVLLLFLNLGCSDKIINHDNTLYLKISFGYKPNHAAAFNPDFYRLTVSGNDFEPIEVIITPLEGVLECQVEVPAGPQRHFLLEGLTLDGRVIYRGETVSDVTENSAINLDIQMYPAIPMLNITPRYTNILMGEPFTVDVQAYKLKNLSTISFSLDFAGTDGLVIPDSVILKANANTDTRLLSEYSATSVAINILQGTTPVSLTDTSGYGTLVTFYFRTHSATALTSDVAVMSLQLYQATELIGDSIAIADIAVDGALIELFRDIPTGDDTLTNIIWQTTFGKSGENWGNSIGQNQDGSFTIVGQTLASAGGILPSSQNWDIYLINIDSTGRPLLEKTIGGSGNDGGYDLIIESDGVVITGWTSSFGNGGVDAYLLKVNAHGLVVWQNSFGYTKNDRSNSIIPTNTVGYLLTGQANRYSVHGSDIYIIKTSQNGTSIWEKTIHLNDYDEGMSAIPASDNGYIITGVTGSQQTGDFDIYAAKISEQGDIIWENTYGGDMRDWIKSIIAAPDGGYLLCGYTFSYGVGSCDIYLIKINEAGDFVWQKTYGGAGYDYGSSIITAGDGGYLIGGATGSEGAGNSDACLLKIDEAGNQVLFTTFGGRGNDEAFDILNLPENKIIIVGATESFGSGGYDAYVVKAEIEIVQ